MKLTKVNSSEKQEQLVFVGGDAVVHLDELEIIDGEGNVSYSYSGVIIENGKQYDKEGLVVSAKLFVNEEYLSNTDYKFLNGYVPKDDEDLKAIEAKRNEAREFIRANS